MKSYHEIDRKLSALEEYLGEAVSAYDREINLVAEGSLMHGVRGRASSVARLGSGMYVVCLPSLRFR